MGKTLRQNSKKAIPIVPGMPMEPGQRHSGYPFQTGIIGARKDESQFFIEITRRWVWSADAKGLFTYVSPSVSDTLGYSPRDLVGRKHFFDQCRSSKAKREMLTCIKNRRPICHMLHDVRHKDGRVRWLSTNATPKLAKDGRFLGYVGLDEDITESVAGQLKLAESEARLSAILENTTDLIWSVEPKKYRLLFWNSAFTEFVKDEYGVPLREGMLCDEVLPLKVAERWKLFFAQVLRDGPFELKYVLHSKKRTFHLAFNLVRNQGVVSSISVFARDITESSKAEEVLLKAHQKLAESQARLSAVVESTSDLIWAVDAKEFGLLTYNTPFADYCEQGLGIRPALGFTPKQLTSTARAGEWESFYRRALEKGPFRRELATISLDRILDIYFTIIKHEGVIFGIAVFGRDVTVERRAQRELEQQRLEMTRFQRVSTIGQLAASLAHQLSQPLTAILANARAATRFISASPPRLLEIQDILEDIIRDDRRAAEVIGQLGTLLNPKRSPFVSLPLNNLVMQADELLRSDAANRQVIVEMHLGTALPNVSGDPVQLTQVILNVMLNGLEAMENSSAKEKPLLVRTFLAADGSVQVCISDNGPGLPPDRLNQLFEPFYTTKKQGLGMGLSVSKAILERHEGRISAENNLEGGATFIISLPAVVSSHSLVKQTQPR